MNTPFFNTLMSSSICSVLGILFLSIAVSIYAQDNALNLANHFFEIGSYENAITEYKRFIYFNPNDETISETFYKIGLAYRSQSNWKEALDAFRKSCANALNDSIRDERRITIGTTLIAKGNYSSAEFELLKISLFSKYTEVKKKAVFFLGVCYIYSFKWDEAEKSFTQYFLDSTLNHFSKIDSLLAQAKNFKYKSPNLAKWLSTFLPGSGQIYAGNWLNGINALIVNGLTTYLLFDALVDKRYEDVLITNITLFERYYKGNRYNTKKMIELRNKKTRQAYAQKVLEYLQRSVNMHK